MYVSKKVRAAVVQRLCDHGGTLTIDKADRAQQHIWGVLDAMAVLGDIRVHGEDRHFVIYRLNPSDPEPRP